MSLRFPYKPYKTKKPLWSLGGRKDRPRPVITIAVVGPAGTFPYPALLDSGADDTVFPELAASLLGIDLTNAPVGEAGAVGGATAVVRYAQVTLRITDGIEYREWTAWVGFTPAKLSRPLLGFAGFFQYFTATFHGDLEEVELTVNSLYQGT